MKKLTVVTLLVVSLISAFCLSACDNDSTGAGYNSDGETISYTATHIEINESNISNKGLYLKYAIPTYTVFASEGLGQSSRGHNLYYHGAPLYYNPETNEFFIYTSIDGNTQTVSTKDLFSCP